MKRKNKAKVFTYDQAEARKDRGVEGLRNMGQDDNADKLDDETVEEYAERKGITLVNPKKKTARKTAVRRTGKATRRRRKNAGAGKTVDFHGAYKTKAAAVAKEKAVGGFIKGRLVGPGDYRNVVMTRKNRAGKLVRKQARRKNSSVAEAAQMFETFHGRRPTSVT